MKKIFFREFQVHIIRDEYDFFLHKSPCYFHSSVQFCIFFFLLLIVAMFNALGVCGTYLLSQWTPKRQKKEQKKSIRRTWLLIQKK